MDKLDFFKEGAPKSEPFKLPSGEEIMISALTLSQRQKMKTAVSKDVSKGTALMICMSCDNLDIKDQSMVEDMDGEFIDALADKILDISGLGDKRKN